jgi:hypothetical protein
MKFVRLYRAEASGGEEEEEEWCGHTGGQSPRGGKMNILDQKKKLCPHQILNKFAR